MRVRRALLTLGVAALLLGACGDDDNGEDTADRVEDTVEDAAEDVAEAADDAWATFRTGFERLVDEAVTGDSEAQEELLDECRDALEGLRKADDPTADEVGELCDHIRDADDETAWDELRAKFEELDADRTGS